MNGKLSLQKITDEKISVFWIKLLKDPWPYWVGAILLAFINILYLAITGKYWSVTVSFARWGTWFLELFGVEVKMWPVWNYYDYKKPWYDKTTWSNLGIIFGAFIAILLAKQFKWKKIKNWKQFFMTFLGGWLMGYGARVAIGCNIGGLYTSISSLAVNGWLYLPFIILGVYLGSIFIKRWFI